MRAVVQRVTSASVTVENETVGAIDAGMMVLIGVSKEDTDKDLKSASWPFPSSPFTVTPGAAAGLPISRLPVRKWPMSFMNRR